MDKTSKLSHSTSSSNERNNDYYSIDVVNKILKDGLRYFRRHQDDNNTITDRLAVKYNEDGNLYFKSCKYTLSIICFQEGLKLDFKDNQLRADMSNNLSAVFYSLKDYGSSLLAAEEALKLMPGYEKAFLRAINCCISMNDFNKSLHFCHIYLGNIPQSKKIEMEKNLIMNIEEQRILKEINKRKLYIVGQKGGDIIGDINILNTLDTDVIPPRVRLTENERLVWPVLIICPEQDKNILVPNFHEDITFYMMLLGTFSERASRATECKYNVDTINIYCDVSVDTTTKIFKKVQPQLTLSYVLTWYRCPIKDGIPIFMIVISGGQFEKDNLQYKPK